MKIEKTVEIICPVCGNKMFSAIENEDEMPFQDANDETEFQCTDCKAIFTKRQLIEGNIESISSNIEDLQVEVEGALKKKFRKFIK